MILFSYPDCKMERISYNIAENKRVDITKSSLCISFLLIVTIIFFVIGLNHLKTDNFKLKEEKNKLDLFESKIEKTSEETTVFEKEIEKLESKWKREVLFSNSIIQKKKI